VRAVGWLAQRGVELIDCQVKTDHLARFGAREIPREDFLSRLERALTKPTLRGKWDLENPVKPPPAG
jgi:leucyl/phenylalanyl-tRNA--protein transferase